MNIIFVIIIAISLSMDAFSLAIAYGMINLRKKDIITLSTIVGIYHFFMPILGMIIGRYIVKFIHIGEDIIMLVIFSIIGFNMIIESKKEQKFLKCMGISEMILFGLAVSIDSFSVGISLNNFRVPFIICLFLFSFVSFTFTCLGLKLGKKLNCMIGRTATLIGGIMLILLGVFYVIK